MQPPNARAALEQITALELPADGLSPWGFIGERHLDSGAEIEVQIDRTDVLPVEFEQLVEKNAFALRLGHSVAPVAIAACAGHWGEWLA